MTKKYYGKQQELRKKEKTIQSGKDSKVCTKMGKSQSLRNGQSKKEIRQATKKQTLEKKRHRRITTTCQLQFFLIEKRYKWTSKNTTTPEMKV